MKARVIQILLATLCTAFSAVPESNVDALKDERRAAAIAYNYCVVSLTKINESKDVLTCNMEIENVVNNINLRKISDEQLKDTLVTVMSFAKNVLINKKDGDLVEAIHATEAKEKFNQTFPRPAALLNPNPFALSLAALQAVGGTYLYFVNNSSSDDVKLRQKKWVLEKSLLENVVYARTIFIDSAYRVFHKRNTPDSYRLTEKQIISYLEDVSEPDSQLRLKRLMSKKGDFSAYPPFWYFLGKTALECSNQELALKCFAIFDEIHEGILRKDPFAVGTSMARCSILLNDNVNAHKEQALLDIARIIRNSWETEWSNFLFCSLAYAQLEMYEEAFKALEHNKVYFSKLPEAAKTVTLDAEMSIAAKNNNVPRIKEVLNNVHSQKIFDALYILSIHMDIDVFNKLVRSDGIIVEKALYSGSDVRKWMKTITSIYLPREWSTENLNLSLDIDGVEIAPYKVQLLKDKRLLKADFYDSKVLNDSDLPSNRPLRLIVKTHKIDAELMLVPVFAPRVGGRYELSHYFLNSIHFSGKDFVYDKEKEMFVPSNAARS
jgi:hypothetical protein